MATKKIVTQHTFSAFFNPEAVGLIAIATHVAILLLWLVTWHLFVLLVLYCSSC